MGILLYACSRGTHWSIGIVERHNAVFKYVLACLMQDRKDGLLDSSTTDEELCGYVNQAKNNFYRYSGYSAFQLVFGFSSRTDEDNIISGNLGKFGEIIFEKRKRGIDR